MKTLDVYLKKQKIGELISDKGTLSFIYNKRYLTSKHMIKLSATMPLQTAPFPHQVVAAFFSGLLPDADIRTRLAKYLNLSEQNIFALLAAVGGDCAGAISLFPTGTKVDAHPPRHYRTLSTKEAKDLFLKLKRQPLLAGEDDIRISGAGAQDKLMVAIKDGKIAIPLAHAPSTHIIKPAIPDFEDTVYNEYFCMTLAKMVGIDAPHVQIYFLDNTPFYLVERYDRQINKSGEISRLHQEDFCQALHIPPEMKYENEGGPSLKQCFDLLDTRIQGGFMAGQNKIRFLRTVLFNVLIGNGDAHGKNYSLLYDTHYERTAPLYDAMCTLIYTNPFKAKMAMKIGDKYKFKDLTKNRLNAFAIGIGFKESFIQKEAKKLSQQILKAATTLEADLKKTPKFYSPIYPTIIETIKKLSDQIA